MAASHVSSDGSTNDNVEPPMAASLGGLPVRNQPTNGTHDVAQDNQSDDSASAKQRIEAKRLMHEKQREAQRKAFEEQMRQLELAQEREERELMEKVAKGEPLPPTPPPASPGSKQANGPVRSQSGNDLASFGDDDKKSKYHNAKSMPGSRRHSGEVKPGAEGGAAANVPAGAQVKKDGQPMLNSFLFDDELDADLQNSAWGGKYLQMNADEDKFPVLHLTGPASNPQLSASSAALDLAPLSKTPAQAGARGNLAPGSRAPGASEWPAFGEDGPSTTSQPANAERHRSVTLGDNASSIGAATKSPSRAGSSALPPPRAGVVGAGSPSGRDSPALDKKIGGGAAGGLDGLGKTNGFSGVDSITDQFSHFNIDTNAFTSYVHDHGAFVYDGNANYGGSMGANRFAGLRLEDLQGDMLPLCKDQFGCRYLQKKLEDGNPEHRDMIFNEVFPHFAELMTDPFANYLAQRLLEYATDEQRDALIESISGELVSISLNMHGTRAVQKMIDYLSTQRQVQSLILALNLNVITLIKDLNGNHVIQKCLNHLPPEDNQFVYNAVATHCIEVATHRHGCCVLQRCIDHASESQRIQLVTEITYNSLTLVQDAFGNYVVQYVLDLNDNRFIEAIVRQFLGNVAALSAQKFSSNVVEKCIRVADATGRRAIIDELLNKQRLERLLRDSFANYVVQTALDYAEPAQRAQLIETIRPILPMIRNTPYGKRIQSKVAREDHHHHRGHHHGHHPMHGGYYGMIPPQFMHNMHMGPPPPMGEYGPPRGYMGGYPGPHQGPPPHHHQGPPPHQQGGPQGFAPFPPFAGAPNGENGGYPGPGAFPGGPPPPPQGLPPQGPPPPPQSAAGTFM
ncbi:hypothetical protein OIO90_006052 [Microbotryomycetes sp. JL221]|nr:hypothetical protein OIO90_006052 [Microbotryomycetes sp. JL221]